MPHPAHRGGGVAPPVAAPGLGRADHGHPAGVAGTGQCVQLTEKRPEVVTAGAPELGFETLQCRVPSREPFASPLQRQAPLHDHN